MTHKEIVMKNSTPWFRWLITLILGYFLWDVGKLLGGIAAVLVAGDENAIMGNFWPLIVLGSVQVLIILFGLKYVWRIVGGGWETFGLVSENWKQDVLTGGAVGLILALIQFFIVLPLTGGSQRSDVIASAEIFGNSSEGLAGAIIFGLLAGAIAEEVWYRGHLILSMQKLLGGERWALWIATIFSIGLFAYGHAYQGLVGVLNTGLIAVVYTGLFLWSKRLAPGMVAHGVYNTLAFLGVYFLVT
jgi:membrane protease YdiL (CAAX protease family)